MCSIEHVSRALPAEVLFASDLRCASLPGFAQLTIEVSGLGLLVCDVGLQVLAAGLASFDVGSACPNLSTRAMTLPS